jgi:hypothetical protein
MADVLAITQVLLLFDEKNSKDYGLALWAALSEVEQFYNLNERRVEIRRLYISPYVPAPGIWSTVLSFLQAGFKSPLELLRQGEQMKDEQIQTPLPDEGLKDRNEKTYDQAKLLKVTRERIMQAQNERWANSALLIVTDRPITPPPEWRYIIWETGPAGAVLSITPLDPDYWRDPDPRRVATIKSRVRAATLAICGGYLGLERCKNPRCYMFDEVDSVVILDRMIELGSEHPSDKSVGFGFAQTADDPNTIQTATPSRRKGPR